MRYPVPGANGVCLNRVRQAPTLLDFSCIHGAYFDIIRLLALCYAYTFGRAEPLTPIIKPQLEDSCGMHDASAFADSYTKTVNFLVKNYTRQPTNGGVHRVEALTLWSHCMTPWCENW